jgi:type II secretory pathway pseudopilin PulG
MKFTPDTGPRTPDPERPLRPAHSLSGAGGSPPAVSRSAVPCPLRHAAAFTMIEIALCLAIIGFALIAIIGVLPLGMGTQRETREETIISQDATMLLEAIRNGSRGLDDLTNNVYAITNYAADYDNQGKFLRSHVAGYTRAGASINSTAENWLAITNGLRIIGLLSTPEYTTAFPGSFTNVPPMTDIFGSGYTSNHLYAFVRSFSGLAAEKPPQNNQIMQEETFSYQVLCVNAPMAADTNEVIYPGYTRQLAGNLRELRLLFLWPQYPNGKIGPFRQTFRASVGGQLGMTNDSGQTLYFYQPQSFTNSP